MAMLRSLSRSRALPLFSLGLAAVLIAATAWLLLPIGGSAAAPLIVDNLGDSGPGTLRQEMLIALGTPGEDTINFSVSGTIVLATTLPQSSSADGLIIDGAGQDVTVSGGDAVTIDLVTGKLDLKNIAITHGNGGDGIGGALDNRGTLTLTNVTMSDNSAAFGGAIYNRGSLTITNSTLTGNKATAGNGGAIEGAAGSVTTTGSTFSNNTASDEIGAAAGGAVHAVGAADFTGTIFLGNSSANGGALAAEGETTISDDTFTGNMATSGGAIHNGASATTLLTGSVLIANNATTEHGNGGGLINFGALTVQDTRITHNTAVAYGGGISTTTDMTIDKSSVSDNSVSAGDGGGMIGYEVIVTITDSTFSGNSASLRAGAIFMEGQLTVTNSTLSGNTAGSLGGAVCCFANFTIASSTIADNSAGGGAASVQDATPPGGGINNFGGSVNLTDDIFSNNTGSDCSTASAATTSGGHNLTSDTSCGLSGSGDKKIDAMLGPLADNGGQTLTHALMDGSPAINKGASCPDKDQRGAVRVGACDIGAFEFGGVPPATGTGTPTPTPGPVHLRGDGDCSGVVDALDAIAALSQLLDSPPGAACGDLANADCDGDIDEQDALSILLYAAGAPREQPQGCGPIGQPTP
ncbi:MAG: choice-of-anchor Q domain-containing protein [Chloroflexota bacterium]